MGPTHPVIARARTDGHDRLVAAEEPLAGLQRRCGGELPGTVAVPQLLEIVRKARTLGLRLARTIEAFDGEETVRAWVEIAPDEEVPGEGGCSIVVGAWQATPRAVANDEDAAVRKLEIDRNLADFAARLDAQQRVLAVEARAPDLQALAAAMRSSPDRPWSDHLRFPAIPHRQPVHWRLLDGATCEVPGSARTWRVAIAPAGQAAEATGFELLLLAETPPPARELHPAERREAPSFGCELSPVLRQPIARIIANAETIRSRLAGPLADEYSNYAADIAAAGQHLLALIEDLSDLEVVESEDFVTAPDRIDLADVARRAVGILGVRARERGIALVAPADGESLPATAEFRRVLQILLNLVGNAIRYSPEGSTVRIELDRTDARVRVSVIDEGPGLRPGQHALIFEKFERLGRANDGGSGLGLYISRRLARAMDGDLSVASEAGHGATFTLELPPG